MILKFINGRNRNLSQLRNTINYVKDDKKTHSGLMGGYCCDIDYPFEDMSVLKQLYNKASGKQYEHYVISFDPEDNIDDDKALEIISEIVRVYGNYQAFYALHMNTGHLHAHVVMNSVGSDGTKFRQWVPQLQTFKERINTICYQNGIEPVKGTAVRKPVDDLDLLEFTENELIKGGYTMKTINNSAPYYPADYDDNHFIENEDGYYDSNYPCGNDDYDGICNELYIGTTYNIKGASVNQIGSIAQACPHNVNFSPSALKNLMNYLGNGIGYHIGDIINISLAEDDDSEVQSEHESPNADIIDVDDFDIYPPDDESE